MNRREKIKKEIEIQKKIEGEKCQDKLLLLFLDSFRTVEQWRAFVDVRHHEYGKYSYQTHRFYYLKQELIDFIKQMRELTRDKKLIKWLYSDIDDLIDFDYKSH